MIFNINSTRGHTGSLLVVTTHVNTKIVERIDKMDYTGKHQYGEYKVNCTCIIVLQSQGQLQLSIKTMFSLCIL